MKRRGRWPRDHAHKGCFSATIDQESCTWCTIFVTSIKKNIYIFVKILLYICKNEYINKTSKMIQVFPPPILNFLPICGFPQLVAWSFRWIISALKKRCRHEKFPFNLKRKSPSFDLQTFHSIFINVLIPFATLHPVSSFSGFKEQAICHGQSGVASRFILYYWTSIRAVYVNLLQPLIFRTIFTF